MIRSGWAVSSRLCKKKKLAVEFVEESNGMLCPLFLQFDDAKINSTSCKIRVHYFRTNFWAFHDKHFLMCYSFQQ